MRHVYAAASSLALLLAPMINPGLATADQFTWPTGSGQPIDHVIQRALSQRGVPYVYGGGNVSGPTNGIRPDAGTPPRGTTPLPGTTLAPAAGAVPGTTFAPGAGAVPSATTVGFDSSGLIQYAFAGAGIKMPRTSGEQCNVGRKVSPAQAHPGDLICYGPGGNQSVAMYLGNGQMIEATEPAVTVSQARTNGMSPY
ncbi:MAG: NlpC/P60 family peptidoglycan-binding protein RipD, partial [Pseudonocardiaceae bacterium]